MHLCAQPNNTNGKLDLKLIVPWLNMLLEGTLNKMHLA